MLAEREAGFTRLAPELPRSWSLMDPLGLRIFEALLGVKPTSAPGWKKYQAHVVRRNRIVHRGSSISETEALESIDAVVEMVRFVQETVQDALEGRG
jgi:hypothetical protein